MGIPRRAAAAVWAHDGQRARDLDRRNQAGKAGALIPSAVLEEDPMAARSTWKGALRLSLITIPIRVFPTVNPKAEVSFRQLHRVCSTPIQLKKWCPHCNVEVDKDDTVRGYEVEKGSFVRIEEEEIARARPKATHLVEIAQVIDADRVDPIYIAHAHYLAPQDKTAGSPFSVIREALEGKAGIGRLALHGRDYLVAVAPRGMGLVMYTLRRAAEVRAMSGIEELAFADTRVKPEEVKLARQVLGGFETGENLSHYADHYKEALRQIIASKTAVEPAPGVEAPGPRKVVNLMDALRASLERAGRAGAQARRSPARRPKPARMLKHTASGSRRGRRAS
jgi:DNA end-binding protein Ku